MKRIFLLVTIFLCGAFLFACDGTTSQTTDTTTDLAAYDYSDFSDFFITDIEQQLQMSQTEYYIYFFNYTCLRCGEIKTEILTKVAGLEIDTFYFVVATSLSDINSGINVTKTPSLVFISNGTFVTAYVGVTDIRNVLDDLS